MTLSPWIIYLWGIADNFPIVLQPVTLVLGIASIITTLLRQVVADHEWGSSTGADGIKKARFFCVVGAVLSALMLLLVPSSKVVAVMIVVPAIMNSEPIQKDLPEIYQMAKEALKQTLQTK